VIILAFVAVMWFTVGSGLDDGQRVPRAITQVEGRRLAYRESVDNPPYLPAKTGQIDAPFDGE
jgi:hypothetical protein